MNKNIHKNQAFTLIELLVVIVIIGILATISTATLDTYNERALTSKYALERNQAAKERYEECLSLNDASECFPVTQIIVDSSSGLLRRANPDRTQLSAPITITHQAGSASFAPSGKEIIYINDTDGRLYRKDVHTVSDGTAITTHQVSRPAYSPDGQHIIYVNQADNLIYRKDANDANNGTAITTNTATSGPIHYSADGKHIFYTNSGLIYKKGALDTGNGTPLTSSPPYFYFTYAISKDNQYVQTITPSNGSNWVSSKVRITDGSVVEGEFFNISTGFPIKTEEFFYTNYFPW